MYPQTQFEFQAGSLLDVGASTSFCNSTSEVQTAFSCVIETALVVLSFTGMRLRSFHTHSISLYPSPFLNQSRLVLLLLAPHLKYMDVNNMLRKNQTSWISKMASQSKALWIAVNVVSPTNCQLLKLVEWWRCLINTCKNCCVSAIAQVTGALPSVFNMPSIQPLLQSQSSSSSAG